MASLSNEEIQKLKAQGFTDNEIQEALKEVDSSPQSSILPVPQPMHPMNEAGMRASSFYHQPSENLIKWQLELNDILERAEHILREDIVMIRDGTMSWEINPDSNRKIFNEYGVQEIMRTLSMYINRNTILADYENQEIKDKVYDFGVELNNLIFMKYEHIFSGVEREKVFEEIHGMKFDEYVKEFIILNFPAYFNKYFGGNVEYVNNSWVKVYDNGTVQQISSMTIGMLHKKIKQGFFSTSMTIATEVNQEVFKRELEKRKNYPIIHREIVDLVHSAYKRALYGGERTSLREARSIMQSETVMPPNVNVMTGEQRKERGIINPLRYIGGKYK